MLPLPDSSTDHLALADWLELVALLSDDLNGSTGDLESALGRGSLLDPEGAGALDRKVLDVFSELELRATAAGPGYPFSVTGPVLQALPNWRDRSSYVFCLCLSYPAFRWKRPRGSPYFPPRLFEALCVEAARHWVGGCAIRFGSPRVPQDLPASLHKALDVLCQELIREGGGFRKQPYRVHWSGDSGLDLVAWRDWPDGLSGKIILFGACASGQDWEDKTDDLNLEDFFKLRMVDYPESPVMPAFFVPHRVPQSRWRETTVEAGIIFDRCRIASLAPKLPPTPAHGDGVAWTQMVLAAQGAP
jgi:hypothetical protein